MASIPPLPPAYRKAADFDWAMHPGGATILSGAERVLDITPEHMRASYDTYINHGNSSSATIFSVMNRLRSKDMDAYAPGGRVRDYVVGCAFGPGITVEACLLKRNFGPTAITGLQTPPETESEASRSEAGDEAAVGAGPEWELANPSESQDKTNGPTRQAPESTQVSGISGRAQGKDDGFIEEALGSLELD
jgi:fungal type III polyketide synthase